MDVTQQAPPTEAVGRAVTILDLQTQLVEKLERARAIVDRFDEAITAGREGLQNLDQLVEIIFTEQELEAAERIIAARPIDLVGAPVDLNLAATPAPAVPAAPAIDLTPQPSVPDTFNGASRI